MSATGCGKMWEVCRGCCTELAGSLRLTVNTLIVITAFQKTFSCGPSLHQVKATKKTVTSNIGIQHIMFSCGVHTLNSSVGRAKAADRGLAIAKLVSKRFNEVAMNIKLIEREWEVGYIFSVNVVSFSLCPERPAWGRAGAIQLNFCKCLQLAVGRCGKCAADVARSLLEA